MSPTRTTLAIGTSRISRTRVSAPAAPGFTLIEIMVVLVIIGLMVAGAVLALGSLGRDRSLDDLTKRLDALVSYARERAELQTREFGLRILPDGYAFMVLEVGLQKSQWRYAEDDALRRRAFPLGVQPELYLDGRKVILQADHAGASPVPQIMLLSSGDLSAFELKLFREGVEGATGLRSTADNHVEMLPAAAK